MNLLSLFLPLIRRQWLMMLTGLTLAIVTLLAGIGLLSLSGWFLSATAVAGLSVATAQTFNFFTPAGGVRFLSIARTASRYGERLATHEATFRLLTELRVRVWKALMPLDEARLAGERRGELLNRLVADIDTLDHFYLRLMVPMGAFIALLLALFAFIGWFDMGLALTLCGALLLCLLIIPAGFYLLGRQSAAAVVNGKRRYRLLTLEYLGGLAELAMFKGLKGERALLDSAESEWQTAQRAMASLLGLSQAVIILAHGAIVLLMLYLAAQGVGERVPPGPLAAMVLFAALATMELLQPLASAFSQLSGCAAAAGRVKSLLDEKSAICFGERDERLSGEVGFKNVSFSYDAANGSGNPVLNAFNLTVAAGTKVAILGKTGAGKSSLFALLCRSYEPQHGSISIGGVPITELNERALRATLTVVTQRVHLFAGPLRDNLALACEQKVADATLIEVLEQVGLGYLASGDEGLGQWIGEGGRQLSGGEQRRIGIARALLRDTPIMLLDEPTEGLDSQTEQLMLARLFEHAKGKTLLMISHRLTAMAEMDCIHILEGGQLVASGKHTELLAAHPEYRSLKSRN
ncbi:cysteine/glutathione ABC transporter ATP-binding protein/permease CydC [Shewanella sp. JM162201]|uniref:Cysteine/glutathione ABC transporter ATP-binding protein/permease CydC n=1 Tax=Shewanella jiangmenensis TaxID=2837387 RepID=A0ABS5V3P5_9GAMM|nr:cysteine/glutathione ABC transporter ATP-binding protein/permease CydC [Shewanella jiangmenensis]MBT1444545.1 cysteine/glutathione ABC transporter ATP-binding protein/permease CydC [Shewanella jiangmenensis]